MTIVPPDDPLKIVARELLAVARAADRDELAERLAETLPHLDRHEVRVVVVGGMKQGKSALVNAVVGSPVCPVGDVAATSVPTYVSYGQEISAHLVTEPTPGTFARRTVQPRELVDRLTDAGPDGRIRPLRAEIEINSPHLANGLVMVDTPGVGGTAVGQAAETLAILPAVDAALIVSDATQELTAPELDFAHQVRSMCDRMSWVMSKTDLQPQWARIRDANEQHLRAAGLESDLITTSSLLFDAARHDRDRELARRSGLPSLITHLRDDIRRRVITSRRRIVADEIESVTHHVTMALDAELRTLRASDDGASVIRTLDEAQRAAAALTSRSANWQQTLADGIFDLQGDVDHDLRDRLRSVGREAEELIDECDPGEDWDGFSRWLADAVARSIADNFVWANQRSEHLATVVADHFAIEGKVAVPEFSVDDTDGILRSIAGLEHVDSGELTLGQKLFTGMRGSYGGVLMVGLVTSMAGLALVNPISLAAGLLLGGYAYRQDAQDRLARRRNEAKIAVRKLIEEAIFQISKESRDRLNRVKRVLRDHFTDIASELKRSIDAAIRSSREAADSPPDERIARIAELEVRLAHVRDLRERAEAAVDALAVIDPTTPPPKDGRPS